MANDSQVCLADEIPGYREALAREQFARDAAFIHSPQAPLHKRISGFTVTRLTLRKYLALRDCRLLFASATVPSPGQLAAFLWLLHPRYQPHGLRRWWFFKVNCRKFLPAKLPRWRSKRRMRRWAEREAAKAVAAMEIVGAIRQYLDDAFMDRPPRVATVMDDKDYYSDGAFWCGFCGRQFGWDVQTTMDTDLEVLFQLVNESRYYHSGGKALMFNPSDEIIANWQRDQTAKANNQSQTSDPRPKSRL
jgi:hypothetical protein